MSQRTALAAQGMPALPPRRRLLAGAAASALGLTGWHLFGRDNGIADAPVTARRRLRFADRGDGGIDVIDADSSARIEAVYGEQGFLRGTLRALMRERRRRELAATAAPIELLARSDGRLTLHDPATGERIDLESFGPSNLAVYARWLPSRPQRSPS
jgi:putative photosynthetic complex assembly protein